VSGKGRNNRKSSSTIDKSTATTMANIKKNQQSTCDDGNDNSNNGDLARP